MERQNVCSITHDLTNFYISWISDWNLESEGYLSLWPFNWSNCYFNLRTAVLFVACGFFMGYFVIRKVATKTQD
jgi:hypothetical protein